jgi:hypothetical protein
MSKKEIKKGLTVYQLQRYQSSLSELAHEKNMPIGSLLAIVLTRIENYLEKPSEDIKNIIAKYATLLEDGTFLGREYETKELDAKGNKIKKRYDCSKGYLHNWIEVSNKEAYEKEIKKILDFQTCFEFDPVNANKKVRIIVPQEHEGKICNVEVERPLLDVLETKLSPDTIKWLLKSILKLE